MSVNKNSAFVSNMTRPVLHALTNGQYRAHFLPRLHWLMKWRPRPRKEKPQPIVAEGFEPGNERFVKGGYYRISAEQSRQERTLDILTVNLLQPHIR